jgi:hypothetical protein
MGILYLHQTTIIFTKQFLVILNLLFNIGTLSKKTNLAQSLRMLFEVIY